MRRCHPRPRKGADNGKHPGSFRPYPNFRNTKGLCPCPPFFRSSRGYEKRRSAVGKASRAGADTLESCGAGSMGKAAEQGPRATAWGVGAQN